MGLESQDVVRIHPQVGIGAVEVRIEPQMNRGRAEDDNGLAVTGKTLRHGLKKAVDFFANRRVPVGWGVVPVHSFGKSLPAEPDALLFLQPDQMHGLVHQTIAHAGVRNQFLGEVAPFFAAAQPLAAEDAGDQKGFVVIIVRGAGQIQNPDALCPRSTVGAAICSRVRRGSSASSAAVMADMG